MGLYEKFKDLFRSWDNIETAALIECYGELPEKGKIYPVSNYGLTGYILQISIQTKDFKGVFDIEVEKLTREGRFNNSEIDDFELINNDTVKLYFNNKN